MAEASFLSSQKARLDALQRHQKASGATLLASIKEELRTIQDRLQTGLDSAAEVQTVRETLQTLRRRCTDDELHVSDVRWMHRELSVCQEQLLEMAKAHKAKFKFRRYRAAMMQRTNEGTTAITTPALEDSTAHREPTLVKPQKVQDDRRISGHHSVEVRVAVDGSVYINGTLQDQIVSSNALILENIFSCIIHLEGIYPSLHLRSVKESTIHCQAEATSLHVTSCQDVQLHITKVQQIRLHESNNVQCHVERCTAGIILEGCTRMQFVVQDETVDIHDFQWLRVDTPSPNFTVEYQPRRIFPRPVAESMKQPSLTDENSGTHQADDDGSDDDEL